MSGVSADAVARLEQLYARIPSMHCQGRCYHSCTSIDMSEVERARLAERGFHIPPRRSVAEIREQGRRTGRVDACPALSALGACRVYDVRPLICRAFGAVEGLRCAYDCTPTTRELTTAEFVELMLEIDRISGRELTGVRTGEWSRDREES